MKKLILFDCDGVLVDSEMIASRIDAEILTNLGYPISTEESIKKFTGLDAYTVNNLVKKESGIDLPENFSEHSQQSILCALEKELQPLIMTVLNHSIFINHQKCIASNSPRERVLRSLKITKQDHLFDDAHIFNSSQVKKGKPAPDLFLFAAEKMGFLPKDCLVVEDSIAGIQAAHDAQMKVIGFLGGGHAQFDWYRERIQSQNVPMAFDHNDLIAFISDFIYENRR